MPGPGHRAAFRDACCCSVARSGTYIAIAGNPLARSHQAVSYPTAPVTQSTLRVTAPAFRDALVPAA